VRWTGFVEAPSSGNYAFQTLSNDGLRMWIDGNLVVDNWTAHAATVTDTTPTMNLVKNRRYSVTIEMYDLAGAGVARLYWKRPADTAFSAVPKKRLYAN